MPELDRKERENEIIQDQVLLKLRMGKRGDILVATRLQSVIRDGRNLTKYMRKELREQMRMTLSGSPDAEKY